MLRRIDCRDVVGDLRELLPRAAFDVAAAAAVVAPILDAVRSDGAAAVRAATARFDGVELDRLAVPAHAPAEALEKLDPAVRAAMTEAIRRARIVHEAQRRSDTVTEVAPGGTVTERWVPVQRVGLYVPGGLVAYPSSVIMNVVPAQIAGVRSIALASPPQAEFGGLPHPSVLAACALLGVDEVYAAGGAQAIGMFAYGTDECERVDLITGPGNAYVAAAKRLVRGEVGIDAEAGASEVCILADDSADPAFVAADLVAQAEHDANASCLLVTDSETLLAAVEAELAVRVPAAANIDRVGPALANQSAVALVSDLDQGLRVVDSWAAEHLEVITRDADAVAARVRNAGAIFIGPYSPVPLGDYCAGSNHVLPTGGTARHTAGLSVQTFLRGIHVVRYDQQALAQVAPHIRALGGAEQLHAHVEAVEVRGRR